MEHLCTLTTFPRTLNPYAYGVNDPLAQPDPNGEVVPLIAADALVGGAVGTGTYSTITNGFT